MTDTKEPQQKQNATMPMNVHAQYIKDLSFENPNAPASLRENGEAAGTPEMQINVNMDSNKIDADKNMYEMILTIEARAKRGETILFVAELQYGVVCSIAKNVPEQHIHPLVMIEAPKMAFPFARQILCDAVIAGGYPPLLLNPVDFEGLYIAQYQKEQGEAKKKA
jgi:preprotein translocase subunit SecB